MYLHTVWFTRMKYKRLLLRYLIKLLDLHLRIHRCSQKALSLYQHIHIIFTSTKPPSNQSINQSVNCPPNHARIRAVTSAVVCWLCEKLNDAFQIHLFVRTYSLRLIYLFIAVTIRLLQKRCAVCTLLV